MREVRHAIDFRVSDNSHVVACGRPSAASPSIQVFRAQSLGCLGSGYLSRSVLAFEGVVKLLLRGDSHRGPREQSAGIK